MSSFLKYFRKNTSSESRDNNKNVIDNLKTSDDAKMLSLENEIKVGYVVDVYDGDTCKINMYFKDDIYKWNCRVMGIDTPELRTRDLKEKECGYFVRDKLREKILNQIIIVKCLNFDKYGRLLVYIYPYNDNMIIDDNKSYNQWLIDNKYALPYDGGTKTKIEWDINNIK